MKLIDADKIKGCAKYIKTNENFEPYIMIVDLAKLLDEQPTAYSVDKVVEQLEEQKSGLTEWAEDEAFKLATNNAIEIVKQCGVYEAEQKLKEMGV